MRPTVSSLWKHIYLFQWLEEICWMSPFKRDLIFADLLPDGELRVRYKRNPRMPQRDIQQRNTKETYTRDIQKRPTHDTKRPTHHTERHTIETMSLDLLPRHYTKRYTKETNTSHKETNTWQKEKNNINKIPTTLTSLTFYISYLTSLRCKR